MEMPQVKVRSRVNDWTIEVMKKQLGGGEITNTNCRHRIKEEKLLRRFQGHGRLDICQFFSKGREKKNQFSLFDDVWVCVGKWKISLLKVRRKVISVYPQA
jgi:hypothetical protein